MPVIRDRFASEAGEPARIDITRNGTTNLPSYDSLSRGSQKTYNAPGIDVSAIIKAPYEDRITLDKKRDRIYPPDRLLNDVTGVAATVNPVELKSILQLFRASGCMIRKEGEAQNRLRPRNHLHPDSGKTQHPANPDPRSLPQPRKTR